MMLVVLMSLVLLAAVVAGEFNCQTQCVVQCVGGMGGDLTGCLSGCEAGLDRCELDPCCGALGRR